MAEQLAGDRSRRSAISADKRIDAVSLSEIGSEDFRKFSSGYGELDRVLGGGFAHGSVNLIGGEPGIGKSTLLLQVAQNLSNLDSKVLYVTGEESTVQVKNRADRLGINDSSILIATETNIYDITDYITGLKPTLVLIDSIQTIYNPDIGGYPGTVGQIRECTASFIEYAKKTGTIFILAGHITKEGNIAGPKLLEHMVDSVLYFEGDRDFLFRIIRGVKNRFGPAGEIGIFEMKSRGLVEVRDPSGIFLSDSTMGSGSVISPMMEGSRPFLIEVQGLVVFSNYNVPQRVSVGLDGRKLSLIAAICEKKGGLQLAGMDIFVKMLGGVRAEEAAVDLPVAAALYSSVRNIELPVNTAIFGELGLSGEVRGVANAERRSAEAVRLGFDNLIIPKANASSIPPSDKMNIIAVDDINGAFEILSK